MVFNDLKNLTLAETFEITHLSKSSASVKLILTSLKQVPCSGLLPYHYFPCFRLFPYHNHKKISLLLLILKAYIKSIFLCESFPGHLFFFWNWYILVHTGTLKINFIGFLKTFTWIFFKLSFTKSVFGCRLFKKIIECITYKKHNKVVLQNLFQA